ncbi:DUF2637 domain-containing protein [Paractinoplanes brasiliensis]|uniref:HTH domain-containing protein n=1 Tax=Paractinoplanes brasiliensis TaxID=52695 RepID=A0A4R6JT33_9ACTN|nr:DUF2637 domain-containing protein [Actinoplanes brasiliensis]TDO39784.1 HTH domain-containing protein [Actinoplanes brasiliensis]GID28879.1 hypothetical protein Abr02nite_38620 [Actinoplanes brasiliensis]
MTDAQLSRVRWGVRGALLLGVATSVAANILHALPNPISQAIAAWPPLALLLTVELISRIPVHRRSLAIVRIAATASIAAIAAWVSYWHMAGVVSRYGEVGAAPFLIPLSVDGLVVVASVCLVELSGRMQREVEEVNVRTAVETVAAPDITADIEADAAPLKTRTPRKRDTGKAVAKLRARHPDLPSREIARRLGVTDRTVRRHLSAAA